MKEDILSIVTHALIGIDVEKETIDLIVSQCYDIIEIERKKSIDASKEDVELNELWLLKLGLYEFFRGSTIIRYGFVDFEYLEIIKRDNCFEFYFYAKLVKIVDTVNDLQNLFYALTNKHLSLCVIE